MKRREVIVIIGAGAVGNALARATRTAGHRIASVVSRSASSARKLARATKTARWGTDLLGIPADATMFIIAVPDAEIERVARRLAAHIGRSRRRRKVFHTSGMATSESLRPLRKVGLTVCSIHPIRSFPPLAGASAIVRSLKDEWFGIEGSADAQRWARPFVRTLGGHPVSIPKSKKTQYHIACTFASNYPLVMLRAAELFARSAGISGGILPLRSLLLGSVRNGLEVGPMRAITGPVARGDAETVRRHRSDIRRQVPHLVPLFDQLVSFAVREAVQAGRITQTQQRAVRKALKP